MRAKIRAGLVVGMPVVLIVANLILGIAMIRDKYFNSVSPLNFVALVWGAFSALVAIAPVLAPIYRALKAAITKKPLIESPPVSLDRLIFATINTVRTSFSRARTSIVVVMALLAVDGYGFLKWWWRLDCQPPPSSVIAVPVGKETFIYVADKEAGQVLVFRLSNLSGAPSIIPIGTHGNIRGALGQPLNMIELSEKGPRHLIFVTDIANNNVHVLDATTNTETGTLQAGQTPNSLAITRDHRRLFVSNEQPVLRGAVRVFNIEGADPQTFSLEKIISGVNCPEAFAVSPRSHSDRLYLATQCGGGKDPVFVIDSARASIASSIPNLAVGISIAVSPTGDDRLYIGRGDYHDRCDGAVSTRTGSAVSVVDPSTRKIEKTICLRVGMGPIAISRDENGTYLVVANANWLTVFDRENMIPLNDIPLEGGVSGIGVDGTSFFAYIPSGKRLFLYNAGGLKAQ